MSRAELLAELWPERDTETARHNLDQLLYELRRSLDVSAVAGTTTLHLDASVISADVLDFMSALKRADHAEAVARYGGAFLQGFHIQGAAEFERWVETTRDRLATQHRSALEHLAKHATDSGAHGEAVRWWRQLSADDRLSSRAALGLMRALAAAGDSVGALEHARLYDRVVRTELEAAPDLAVMAFAEALRSGNVSAPRVNEKPADDSTLEPAMGEPVAIAAADTRNESEHAKAVRWYRRTPLYSALAFTTLLVVAFGAMRWRGDRNANTGAARLPASIVVLPMLDQSVGQADGHLADGITEQLISALSGINGLRVIGRTSAFEFKGSPAGQRAIADSLHVSNVLESALQQVGSRVRVTVRLVDASTGVARWGQTYNRELNDVFAVEDDIVYAVAREMRVRLLGTVARRQTNSIAASELYVRARNPVMMRSDSTIRAAIGLLEQAIVLDTAYAAAYAGQAEIYTTAMMMLGPDGRRDMYRRATEMAKRGLALDSASAEAYQALGIVHLFGYRLRDAESELKHARELNPGVGRASYLAGVYQWSGRTDDALVEAQREARDDPLSAGATAGLARALYFARRYDDANVEINKVMALHPPLRRAATYQAEILLAQHRWGDAIAALRPSAQRDTRRQALLGYALARSGARAEAMQVLAQLREGIPTGQGNAFMVAEVYAGLGDFDNAYIWLNHAIDDYSLQVAVMGPAFDDLRADPRFALIRKRLGLETH